MTCRNIVKWNTSLALPMCSEKCKNSLNELEANPIGRRLKCCRCNNDHQCARERRNVGFFCDVDLNNAKQCQNDQMMCNSTRDDGNDQRMIENENQDARDTRDQREREEQENRNEGQNQNEECERNQGPEGNMENRDQFGKMCCAIILSV